MLVSTFSPSVSVAPKGPSSIPVTQSSVSVPPKGPSSVSVAPKGSLSPPVHSPVTQSSVSVKRRFCDISDKDPEKARTMKRVRKMKSQLQAMQHAERKEKELPPNIRDLFALAMERMTSGVDNDSKKVEGWRTTIHQTWAQTYLSVMKSPNRLDCARITSGLKEGVPTIFRAIAVCDLLEDHLARSRIREYKRLATRVAKSLFDFKICLTVAGVDTDFTLSDFSYFSITLRNNVNDLETSLLLDVPKMCRWKPSFDAIRWSAKGIEFKYAVEDARIIAELGTLFPNLSKRAISLVGSFL